MKKLSDNLDAINQQKVLVRCNFDVPIENNQVQDTTRIEAAVPTIKALRQHQAEVILLAHYDRPDGKYDQSKSIRPVVIELEKLVQEPIEFIEYISDINQLTIPGEQKISLIDNLRFWPQEEANDPEFSLVLSKLGSYYVNDAFANCHRQHASIVGIPKHLPSFAGFSLTEEIEVLNKIKDNPEKPLIVVLGGAKLETKEPLINSFIDKADFILVGGKIALDLKSKHVELPKHILIADLTSDGKDITPDSAKIFADRIQTAQTVIWNGTMGIFEEETHQQGTTIVAQAVNTTKAFTLVGGGDTETALTLLKMEDGIDFISTGGGAMLTYLSDGQLPGISALS